LIARLLYKISGRLRCRFIKVNDRPYLERYYLGKALGVTLFLHRFLASDGDRFVHDHPWSWSAALILAGGYDEERLKHLDPQIGWRSRFRRQFPGRLNIITPRTFHRIHNPDPETWTLFLHGRRIKGWGFLSRSEDLPQTSYVAAGDHSRTRGWQTVAPRGAQASREPFTG
jgi:hypothetical protein